MVASDPTAARPVLVVGTDGSRAARAGVEFAADLAVRLGAEVVLVHAMTLLEHLPGRPVVAPHSIRGELEAQLQSSWNEPLTSRDVPHRCVLDDGPPLTVLPRVADEEGAHMLVVASHGKGQAMALALGSTSHGLIQIARRPVVVVPVRDVGQ